MEFVAEYWYVWLIGTFVFGAGTLFQFFRGATGVVGDAISVAKNGIDATENIAGEAQVKDKGIAIARQAVSVVEQRAKEKVKTFASAFVLNVATLFFATSLSISILFNAISMFMNKNEAPVPIKTEEIKTDYQIDATEQSI